MRREALLVCCCMAFMLAVPAQAKARAPWPVVAMCKQSYKGQKVEKHNKKQWACTESEGPGGLYSVSIAYGSFTRPGLSEAVVFYDESGYTLTGAVVRENKRGQSVVGFTSEDHDVQECMYAYEMRTLALKQKGKKTSLVTIADVNGKLLFRHLKFSQKGKDVIVDASDIMKPMPRRTDKTVKPGEPVPFVENRIGKIRKFKCEKSLCLAINVNQVVGLEKNSKRTKQKKKTLKFEFVLDGDSLKKR